MANSIKCLVFLLVFTILSGGFGWLSANLAKQVHGKYYEEVEEGATAEPPAALSAEELAAEEKKQAEKERQLVWLESPNPVKYGQFWALMGFIYGVFFIFSRDNLFKIVRFKYPIILVLASLIAPFSSYFKFPGWWQIEFVAFAFVGLLFFIVLDLKALKPEAGTGQASFRLIVTYLFASTLFITITAQLPQFNPEYELEKLNRPPVKLSGLAGPEVIQAGREVFESNKCFNCHKVFWEGNSDRGPNLGSKQIGLYPEDYIKDQIVNPRKNQSPGYDDPKSKKAMPTYYGEDLGEDELTALVAYLKTLRDPTHIPVEGKFPDQWTWWDDKKIIEQGQVVFEGKEPATEGLNCAVCHGADGIPMMTGAFDFRNPNNPDTTKMADHLDVTLKDFPDELYYKRVTRGIDGTPMAPWGMLFPHLYLWKAEAYARTFHDPLETRTAKKPVPPIPTKEEIEKWKTDGLFLDPLL